MTVPKGGKGGLSLGDDQRLTKIILCVGRPHSYKRCVIGPKHNICFLPSITGLAYKKRKKRPNLDVVTHFAIMDLAI